MFDKIRGFLQLWDLEKLAVKEIKMGTETKPGWKTSEFWLTVLMQTPTVIGLFLGSTNPITLGIGAAVSLAYVISRSQVKGQVVKAAAMAAIQAGAEAAKSADTSSNVSVNVVTPPTPGA